MVETSSDSGAPAVYVLHENPEWIPPFEAAFEAENVRLREWSLTDGRIDLTAEPPEGIFWSRLSASSHTRGNAHAKEYARAIFRWLEAHGRTVINGSPVLELEVSKVAQYLALGQAGFDVPRTVAAFDRGEILAAAQSIGFPLITKHNQGGKGLGVQRFDTAADLAAYVDGDTYEEPVDGITLLQEYLVAAQAFITRAEFIDGRFVYAVQVDTSAGSFELCPAEACEIPEPGAQSFAVSMCTFGPDGQPTPFAVRPEITEQHPLVRDLTVFLADQRIDIAGVEFLETVDGRTVVYDINTNTNYNPAVEETAPESAARAVARALGRRLDDRYGSLVAD